MRKNKREKDRLCGGVREKEKIFEKDRKQDRGQ